eukprot:6213366-Pleurochrysis_carterae.AAC.2
MLIRMSTRRNVWDSFQVDSCRSTQAKGVRARKFCAFVERNFKMVPKLCVPRRPAYVGLPNDWLGPSRALNRRSQLRLKVSNHNCPTFHAQWNSMHAFVGRADSTTKACAVFACCRVTRVLSANAGIETCAERSTQMQMVDICAYL